MQIPLTGKDFGILAGLQGWLFTPKFGETDSGSKICVDEKLREKWDLLCAIDYVQKVWRTAKSENLSWRPLVQLSAASSYTGTSSQSIDDY